MTLSSTYGCTSSCAYYHMYLYTTAVLIDDSEYLRRCSYHMYLYTTALYSMLRTRTAVPADLSQTYQRLRRWDRRHAYRNRWSNQGRTQKNSSSPLFQPNTCPGQQLQILQRWPYPTATAGMPAESQHLVPRALLPVPVQLYLYSCSLVLKYRSRHLRYIHCTCTAVRVHIASYQQVHVRAARESSDRAQR